MRRNGVSPFFSLSLFYFRCCSSTLTQSLACTGYATGKQISYIPFAFTDDKLSQPLSCTSSPYFRRLLPESEQVLQKKTAPEATFKLNIWRASIKLVWRVCFICVFCSCRTNAGIFYALVKKFPVFQESARCYATRMDEGGANIWI